MDDEKRLERERMAFEEEIERQLLNPTMDFVSNKSFMPYKQSNKKLINSLLISLIITLIIGVGGWMYSKDNFNSLSSENVDKIHNAIQFSVIDYYQENNRYPVDIHGNIDFVALKNKGYLTLDIEVYKSKFIYDSQYNVIRLE